MSTPGASSLGRRAGVCDPMGQVGAPVATSSLRGSSVSRKARVLSIRPRPTSFAVILRSRSHDRASGMAMADRVADARASSEREMLAGLGLAQRRQLAALLGSLGQSLEGADPGK
ncbi:hypothetical protein [Streptomyces sp. NPDC001970]